MDKLSYALGMNVGYSYLASGISNLQVDDFAQGVKAVMEQAEPALSIDEAKTIINDFFMQLQEQINKAAGETLKKGEEFLAENAKRFGVNGAGGVNSYDKRSHTGFFINRRQVHIAESFIGSAPAFIL